MVIHRRVSSHRQKILCNQLGARALDANRALADHPIIQIKINMRRLPC